MKTWPKKGGRPNRVSLAQFGKLGTMSQESAETITSEQTTVEHAQADQIHIAHGGIHRAHARLIDVSQGGIALAISESVTVQDGGIAVAFADTVNMAGGGITVAVAREITGNTNILFDLRAALAFGLITGIVVSLLNRLLRPMKC